MEPEDKELLIRDLCARFPYGVKCELSGDEAKLVDVLQLGGLGQFMLGRIEVKPYLRPMSSMTEEEIEECYQLQQDTIHITFYKYYEGYEKTIDLPYFNSLVDFYNSHHLDYRGLIDKGLALEAKEGMYKNL